MYSGHLTHGRAVVVVNVSFPRTVALVTVCSCRAWFDFKYVYLHVNMSCFTSGHRWGFAADPFKNK